MKEQSAKLNAEPAIPSQEALASTDPERWALEPYPDYVAEVNRSISFSGLGQEFFTVGKARRMLDLMRRFGETPAQAHLLDIGCGVGLIHRHIAPSLGAVFGVDVAADAVEAAKRANPAARYQTYDGTRLPFSPRTFDAATTICVMHHVAPLRWPAFIAEARRVLRPGGLFLVFEHNPWNPFTRRAVSRCAFDFDAVLLSPRRLAGLLTQAGFSEVGYEFLFLTPFSSGPVQWIEDRLRRCPAGAQYVAFGRVPGGSGSSQ
jgi:SAM-dependent methyltransferase